MSQLTDILQLEYSKLVKHEEWYPFLEPRKILTPQNYLPARYVAAQASMMLAQLHHRALTGTLEPTQETSSYSCLYQLINAGMPIFYVAESLARAVADTDLPEDLTLADLYWPATGFALGFPTKFMTEYCGVGSGYVFCGYARAGDNRIPIPSPTLELPRDKIITTFMDEEPVTRTTGLYGHVSAHFIDDKVAGIFDHYGYHDVDHNTNPEAAMARKSRCERVTALVYKLLIILGIQPEFMGKSECARERRPKHPLRLALWTPTMIGEHFEGPTTKPGGQHASPGIHRRSRHLRRQAHGPGMSLRTLKWIKATWIGLKGAAPID
jgi:hypothetical protein